MRCRIAMCLGMLLVAGLAQLALSARAGDWAHWRGPETNGISREKGLVENWSLEDKKNVLWTSDIGGRSTPIVLNGKVYLNCRTEHDVNDPAQVIHARERVVCWDAKTGEVLWQDVFNVFQCDIPAPRIGWAAMVGDTETGNVYVHSVSGLFRCYSGDGKVLWEHSLFEDFGKISGYGGRTDTPIVDEDRVIVSFLARNWGDTKGPLPAQTYYAFDKKTGKLLWTSAPGEKPNDTCYSGLTRAVINGVRVLIGGNGNGGVYCINARTGEKIWGFMISKRGLNSTPVVDDNKVYVTFGEDNIDNNAYGRIQCIDATGKGDVTTTHSVWRIDGIKADYTSCLVQDGICYVVADIGNLYAFDSKTGEQLWTHNLGTVGKGSPVWADGKLYVMEVNGNIHILKPSREKCESLSHVELHGREIAGPDEIYASPAICDGRIYLCTRDRLICLGTPDHVVSSDPIPPLPAETPAEDAIASIKLVPFEVAISGSGEVEYELHAFDKYGHLIKKLDAQVEPQADLPDAKADGAKVLFGPGAKFQAGTVIAKHGELQAKARIRVFSELPWKFDFDTPENLKDTSGWINGFIAFKPTPMGDSTTMLNVVSKNRPITYVWLGPSTMKDYTIQADVLMKEAQRKRPSVGITNQRYNLILKGNVDKLGVQTWPPHPRAAKEVKFVAATDVWYTMKLRVDVMDDGAHVRGKIWKRGDAEPEAWTIEQLDPHPNVQGSPGIYLFSLADSYFDNVIVSKN